MSSFRSLTIDTDDESDDEPAPFVASNFSRSQPYTPNVFPHQAPPFDGPPITPDIDRQPSLVLPPSAKSFASDLLRRDGLDGGDDYDDDYDDADDDGLSEDGDEDNDYDSDGYVDGDYDGDDDVVDDVGNDDVTIDPTGGQSNHVVGSEGDQEACVSNVSSSSQLCELFPKRSQPIPVPGKQRKGNNFGHAHTVGAINSNANYQGDFMHVSNTQHVGLWFLPPGSRRRALASQPTTTQAATSLVVGRPASAQRRSVEFDERAFY